jgi:hypothetical protein
MSVQTDPVPPAPQHTPPREQDNRLSSGVDKNLTLFSQPWIRWFISLRDKVNVLNESIVNLGDLSGAGILVKSGAAWLLRSITGATGEITVADGDGVAGNPVIGLADTAVTPGTYGDSTHVPQITVDAKGRITNVIDVLISGGGGSSVGGITVSGGSPTGPFLTVGTTFSAILPTGYDLTGEWFLWCYPSGSIELDIWVDDFVNIPPVSGDSIVGGNYPAVSTALAASGNFTGWSDINLAESQAITFEIRSSTVRWFTFTMQGIKA